LAQTQVNLLGFSGTSGARGYDAIVADDFVVPPGYEKYYSEEVVRLGVPVISCGLRDCSEILSLEKESHGIDKDSFTFGCLANPYKFDMRIFKMWIEVLEEVPGSTFVAGNMSDTAWKNLQSTFVRSGIAAHRIVRSPFQKTRDEHIARLKIIDLFLDTFPYNAHSLAADAVSAGVPVVTLAGESFASRVAGSLNRAIGLEDFITSSPECYRDQCIKAALEPGYLSGARALLDREIKARNWASDYAAALEERVFARSE
jgi:predicted O-linked N-acetylglucosamine transferase (SPINDLY family)